MFRSAIRSKKPQALTATKRYGIVIMSVTGAFVVAFLLEYFGVRNPFALIFLAAVSVSFWRSGSGPGILAIILSTTGLTVFLR
jgi:K+-sensing histidine kinase KdpD